jgi:type II secretory pathway predicted ATPase ExeA
MYLKFYNLTKEPFHITPDPQFLYASESHKQALASMIDGIDRRKGLIVITGGVGVGYFFCIHRQSLSPTYQSRLEKMVFAPEQNR